MMSYLSQPQHFVLALQLAAVDMLTVVQAQSPLMT
jgi:hypothetical protein